MDARADYSDAQNILGRVWLRVPLEQPSLGCCGAAVSSQCWHDWIRTGSHWVPMFSSWPNNGVRDIEVEYEDFECRICGVKISKERPNSSRPLIRPSDSD